MRRTQGHSGYIWQRKDWSDFRWDAEALLEPMSRLSQLHGLLNGRMSMLGFNEKCSSLLSAMTEELIGSSEIEGVLLNPNSVRSSIARRLGIDDDGLLVEDHYVEGLVDVMLDAVRKCKEPLTDERLFGWHAALFPLGRSGMHRITVADWRKGEEPMQVVSGAFGHEKVHYEAPASADVPAEMERLIRWCNNANLSPFIMAAVAHLWFVTVHPFDDGNGRISRTLADMLLARLDVDSARYYSMSAEINRNKKAYYEILERTQKGDLDITEWLQWFFDCLEKAITRASSIIERTLEKSAYWDKFHDVDINERQRKVINRLWDGFEGKLTSSKWAKMCSCSQDTALRDINDLISKGMLRNSGEGGRSANYLLPE
ncbi:Fic family protein [Bacteroides acidifaciens]|uniref:Fic family protein n=1 Tax=Bacteroides acidifaciens TaxID=85831 RepID=UPI002676E69C|nr:Fic family protein [Bacteroides acidifaciens]